MVDVGTTRMRPWLVREYDTTKFHRTHGLVVMSCSFGFSVMKLKLDSTVYSTQATDQRYQASNWSQPTSTRAAARQSPVYIARRSSADGGRMQHVPVHSE